MPAELGLHGRVGDLAFLSFFSASLNAHVAAARRPIRSRPCPWIPVLRFLGRDFFEAAPFLICAMTLLLGLVFHENVAGLVFHVRRLPFARSYSA